MYRILHIPTGVYLKCFGDKYVATDMREVVDPNSTFWKDTFQTLDKEYAYYQIDKLIANYAIKEYSKEEFEVVDV